MENMDLNLENTQAQMRKGILEYCILLIIARGKMYASDILKELKQDNLLVVEGTLYPLLSRLRAEGLLEYSWQESKSGPPRKYYNLTEKGSGFLDKLIFTWDDLVKSIKSLTKKYQSHEKND